MAVFTNTKLTELGGISLAKVSEGLAAYDLPSPNPTVAIYAACLLYTSPLLHPLLQPQPQLPLTAPKFIWEVRYMSCNSSGFCAFGNNWWWIILLIIIVLLCGSNGSCGCGCSNGCSSGCGDSCGCGC